MTTTTRKPYSTDLTDQQWAILQPLIPLAKHGGRPREVEMGEVLNTLFYLNRTGCQWDLLPHDLLPKSTVYQYFRQWRDDGTWQRMMDALRAGPRGGPAGTDAQCRCDRQPNRKNDGAGWRARIRWREEDQRAKTPCFRGYFGALAGGGRDQCSMGRWGRCTPSVQPTRQRQMSQTDQNLGGQQVSQSRTGSVAGEAPRPLGPGDQVSAGRSSRFRACAQTMGRRAHLRLVGKVPPPESGLRTSDRVQRLDVANQFDSPDAPTACAARTGRVIPVPPGRVSQTVYFPRNLYG